MSDIEKRASRNQNRGCRNTKIGNALDKLTDEQRARTFRRLARELIARPATPAAVYIDADDVLSIAVARIARRARISPPHAAVVAELSGFGSGK